MNIAKQEKQTLQFLQRIVDQMRPLTPRQRVDFLLDRSDAPTLLSRLPVQDLFGLIRTVGVADCLELLELCPPPVLQGICDLAVWNMDRLDPRQLASFYAALFHANPEGALESVMAMDLELITIFLKLHTRAVDVVDGISEDESQEDFISMPDHKMNVSFVDPPGLPEEDGDPLGLGEKGRKLARHAARTLVQGLIARNPLEARKMMDSIRYELPSQLEEDALQFRNARMEDLGFPPRDEALGLLAYMDPDSKHLAPAVMRDQDITLEDHASDLSLALFAEPESRAPEHFLGPALAGMDEIRRRRVARELVLLCNRVMVARATPLGDLEEGQAAVRDARIMVDLGLAYRSGGDVKKATAILDATAVQDLYRVGHSLTLKLQREAKKLATPERGGGRKLTSRLDAPHGLVLAGLLNRQPLYFKGLAKPGELGMRPFASLDDLATVARSVSESAFRLALGFDVLGIKPIALEKVSLEGTNLGDAAELTLEILFTTALARAAAGGKLDAAPLSKAELEAARQALKNVDGVARASKALGDVVGPKAPLPGAGSEADARARAASLAGVLLTRLDEEIGHVPAEKLVDGRFVTRALVRV